MFLNPLRFVRLLFTAVAALIALNSCMAPPPPPRPFARGRSLDQPPRYGETNRYGATRYMQPGQTQPPSRMQVDPDIDPRTVPPGVDLTPPPGVPPPVDPGLAANPPAATPPAGTLPPAPGPTNPSPTPSTPEPTKPAAGDVPYARAVPGKPGFVYSPHEQGKILDVTGLRPGTKVKDPQTGAMFRVP